MIDEYKIEAATEKDIEKISALENICFSSPMSKDNLRAFLLGENGLAFVCYETDKKENALIPCAYGGALCVFDEAQILNIATHPDHRGRGLGRLVTEKLINCAAERGASYVTLEVRESNKAARHLYDRLGFYEVGRIKNYYRSPSEDALILKLDISDQGGRR